jgi:hypothetical protein
MSFLTKKILIGTKFPKKTGEEMEMEKERER